MILTELKEIYQRRSVAGLGKYVIEKAISSDVRASQSSMEKYKI